MDENRSGVRPEQSQNELEDDGLACAAGAEQNPHRARGNGEAQILQDNVLVER
jgi:hypothetical protein